MNPLVLHQYADSPFSEKIRALLGYKRLAHQSVEIPAIMPKPDVVALTGGYRRTPIVQRGADIFCDTALIAEVIEAEQPDPPVAGGTRPALCQSAARWTDSEFFRVCVGLVFQPRALAANPRFQDAAAAQAFLKDRSAFTAGSSGLATPLPRAEAIFRQHLAMLEQTLGGFLFLNGERPEIVDFSTWHCCWFVQRQKVLADYFAPYPNVRTWMKRMAVFSAAAQPQMLSSTAALELAHAAQPEAINNPVIDPGTGLQAGQSVQVLPTDYGFQAVTGELLAVDDQRISIARTDPRAARLHVHFPRYGFEVSPSDARS